MANYDILIIGSGPGGYVAAIRASQLKMKVGIIEKSNLGGVCLNIGCIPTKALLKSAEVYEYVTHASDYGINLNGAHIDFQKIIKRSRDVADSMSKGVQFLMKKNKIDVIAGHGKINRDKSVTVTDANGKQTSVTANHIIISTGARPRSLPNMPMDGKKIISYKEAMLLNEQPKSMIIVGAGAIGVEFAYFYHTLGTKVTLIEMLPNILPIEDEEISKALERIYKKKGMKIITNSVVEKIQTTSNGVKASVKTSSGTEEIEVDVLLSAVGIIPNTENLGLEESGIETNKGWIKKNEFYETNEKGIYAIGDVSGPPWLAHVASAEGIICVEKIAGKNPEPMDYNNIPGCTYCQPQVASVGYTEKAARNSGYEIRVGKFPFTASGKAKAIGKTDGMVKVIFDAKYGEWLGCHILASEATEMIEEAVVARKLETTGEKILKSVHPHPTLSEAVMEAVADAYGEVIHL